MAPESNQPLDTSSLQAAYPHQDLPVHERYGIGERYTFGKTLLDVHSDPPGLTPLVAMRMVKGYLAVGDVLHISPTQEGGVHIDSAMTTCEIGKTGDLALVYTAPHPEPRLLASQDGYTIKDAIGRKYTQSSLVMEGKPEGVRVTIFGVVHVRCRMDRSSMGRILFFAQRPLTYYDKSMKHSPE